MAATSAGRRCLLALGSNLGNRLANLQDALHRLGPWVSVEAVSALYESDPVGPPGQPPYFNAVADARTALAPLDLLRLAKRVEWALGRRPGPHWGPRPVDIDLLLLDGVRLDTPALALPHPRIEERAFVLTPLADVAPDLILPRSGLVVAAVAERAGRGGLRRIAGAGWRALDYAGSPAAHPAMPV
jgi:2-amino-4-hydroxy-6-hydroxymethyldihydropteridine diphosphokinase